MGVIDRLCALAGWRMWPFAPFPPPSRFSMVMPLLNGQLDDSVDRCLVSVHLRPVPYIPVSNRVVIWAEFRGCSTADTPVDVADFHCDLVVGCECSPLFRVVIDDRSVAIVLFP